MYKDTAKMIPNYLYVILGVILCILIVFCCAFYWKRRRIIHKVCCMCMEDKCRLLDDLVRPFGYSYVVSQDLFTTRLDAWQREFGYCDLYDKTAAGFHMIIDCLPVYFNYGGRTWMIEFWKGQYGINTGCEIGVYYADGIVEKEQLKKTLFDCVDNEDMQKISFTLSKKGCDLARLSGRHWWLTAFLTGEFSRPSELTMDVRMTLADCEMAEAFADGLLRTGYDKRIYLSGNQVAFTFDTGIKRRGLLRKIQAFFAQACNRFWCRVYRMATRPFQMTVDRVLYLYFFLPFAFRRTFRRNRFRKSRKGNC